jgi:hypothetical protein
MARNGGRPMQERKYDSAPRALWWFTGDTQPTNSVQNCAYTAFRGRLVSNVCRRCRGDERTKYVQIFKPTLQLYIVFSEQGG